MTTSVFAIIGVLAASFIGAFAALLLKKGSKNVVGITSLVYNKQIIMGVILYGMSTVLFLPALKYGELSVLYPIISTGFIWVSVLSVFFIGESITLLKLAKNRLLLHSSFSTDSGLSPASSTVV